MKTLYAELKNKVKKVKIEKNEYKEKNKLFFSTFKKAFKNDNIKIYYLKKETCINDHYYDFIIVVKDNIPNAIPVAVFKKCLNINDECIKKLQYCSLIFEDDYKRMFENYYKNLNNYKS